MTLDSINTKPVLYIDMDNTLVDFVTAFPRVGEIALEEYAGREDDIPGIFALMDPMPGAIEAVHTLAEHYDIYVLSTAPWANPRRGATSWAGSSATSGRVRTPCSTSG